jgi:DNA modification methylase
MTDLSHIAEPLRPLAVPIDELHEDPANARVDHDLDRIAASLRAYGQRKPIIANRLQSGKIEAGNGTWRAANMSRKDYHTQYEPMWYGWDNRAPRLVKVESRKLSDVWLIDRPKKSEEHPTMKPLELVERSLLNSSAAGALVLDLFAGSGTTLLACERTGRVCRTMDNDPKYVAVCLERWSVATGQQPTLESA